MVMVQRCGCGDCLMGGDIAGLDSREEMETEYRERTVDILVFYELWPEQCFLCRSLYAIAEHLGTKVNYFDCAKHDPEVSEDTEKNFSELLSEELKLREAEAVESQQRADMALLEAKKMTSQYQKEADKCNSGMETCEEAREKAEAALVAQKRLTLMWELRARQKGWKEGAAKSRAQSQGNVQTS
ncbi:hypothetical protein RJ639_029431 [Escallonia herrerae]|uniref:Uncharacterized protein n=1 Tax=Escallonia herrerae TaxID=1293975 RepID=A0AA88QEM0_9ASTE|nr:hypothetical protein RJ639_029431 [Escallonia herrerae]